jgi:hypothetical protein
VFTVEEYDVKGHRSYIIVDERDDGRVLMYPRVELPMAVCDVCSVYPSVKATPVPALHWVMPSAKQVLTRRWKPMMTEESTESFMMVDRSQMVDVRGVDLVEVREVGATALTQACHRPPLMLLQYQNRAAAAQGLIQLFNCPYACPLFM